jgi:hypothetical protein
LCAYWTYKIPSWEPVEKSRQVTRFDQVLVYSISAGAGNQANILDKRCSVTPL